MKCNTSDTPLFELLVEYHIENKFKGISNTNVSLFLKHNVEELEGFSKKCYCEDSIPHLQEALVNTPDKEEMNQWNIGEAEWHDSIVLALYALIGDEICYSIDNLNYV